MAKSPEGGSVNSPESSSSKVNGVPLQPASAEARNIASASEGRSAASSDAPTASTATSASGASAIPKGRMVSERKGQYLIAARRPIAGVQAMNFQPLQFSMVEQALRASPDIEVIDTVGPKSVVGALADGMGEAPSVLVARMTEEKANVLHQQAQGRLIIERDQHLALMDQSFLQPSMVGAATPSTGPVLAVVVLVLGRDNQPLPDAEVYLFGSMLPASGTTDAKGQITLSLFGETARSIRGLYVKPKADYWSFYQRSPEISTDEVNVVVLRALSDWPSLADFPTQQVYGWGQKAMRLDQLPGTYRGQGIKIAVIDSGAATAHEDLSKIRFGFDIINKKTNPATWNQDSIGHGSHCAGVIAGADNAVGVRGFAPDAEVHVCKLFPGGQISQLIDALEYCIEKQIDVVNLSLGGAEPSEALEQQIMRAKRAGVACIVAAGNSGGTVQYPASSPNVLAVAAIGKLNEFPPDSYHSETLTQYIDRNGFFSAKFTCYGAQIAVCAPGVAVTSSVPDNNYAVWDGTSMAAPHITGLAALTLAHHPDFQAMYKTRSAERVERLFQIIKQSARRLNLGDPSRTGFGLPDVLVAVGLQSQIAQGSVQQQAAAIPQSVISTLMARPAFTQSGVARSAQIEPFGAVGYPDQIQLTPQMAQTWLATSPWGQVGQQFANQGVGMVGMMDPNYAASVSNALAQQLGGVQQFPYGMATTGFGRAGW